MFAKAKITGDLILSHPEQGHNPGFFVGSFNIMRAIFSVLMCIQLHNKLSELFGQKK